MALAWLTTVFLGTACLNLPADHTPASCSWPAWTGRVAASPALGGRKVPRKGGPDLGDCLDDDDTDEVLSAKRRGGVCTGSAAQPTESSAHLVSRRHHCRGFFEPPSLPRVYLFCALLI
jgi:hypothetical protein